MPQTRSDLETLRPDHPYVCILRRPFSSNPVSQNEPLVNRLDASERLSHDFAHALARLAEHTWLELNDLPCDPVDMTRHAMS